MLRYIVGRLLIMIPTVLVLSLVLFVLMRLTPGSPLQPVASNANPLSPEQQANLAKAWGLDKPILEQYAIYLGRAVQLDFGTSYVYKTRSVWDVLAPLVPVSLHLGLMAMSLAVVVGGALGILAAMNQNGPLDYLCTFIAMLGVSLPNFVIAVLMITLFVLGLKLVPDSGGWNQPSDWILPTVTLALNPLAVIAR